jgi:hypothetical protein
MTSPKLLKQPRAHMILKQLSVAHIASQSVHRLVAALVHHLENRLAGRRGRGQEAGTKRMAGELLVIEPSESSIGFDDSDWLVSRSAATLRDLLIGLKIGPDSMSAASSLAIAQDAPPATKPKCLECGTPFLAKTAEGFVYYYPTRHIFD